MFTIDASSTTINWAIAMTMSAFQRRGSAVVASGGVESDVIASPGFRLNLTLFSSTETYHT